MDLEDWFSFLSISYYLSLIVLFYEYINTYNGWMGNEHVGSGDGCEYLLSHCTTTTITYVESMFFHTRSKKSMRTKLITNTFQF